MSSEEQLYGLISLMVGLTALLSTVLWRITAALNAADLRIMSYVENQIIIRNGELAVMRLAIEARSSALADEKLARLRDMQLLVTRSEFEKVSDRIERSQSATQALVNEVLAHVRGLPKTRRDAKL